MCTNTVTVYCENYTEHVNTLSVQKAEFIYVKSCSIYNYHFVKIVMEEEVPPCRALL
jgi:hypothetical protein